MANLTPQQRASNGLRRRSKEQRRVARQIARGHLVDAVIKVAAAEAPDWFTSDQQAVYDAELCRLLERTFPREYRRT